MDKIKIKLFRPTRRAYNPIFFLVLALLIFCTIGYVSANGNFNEDFIYRDRPQTAVSYNRPLDPLNPFVLGPLDPLDPFVLGPLDPKAPIPTIDPVSPVVPVETVDTIVPAEKVTVIIPVTGIPSALLILAVMIISGGLLIPKINKISN